MRTPFNWNLKEPALTIHRSSPAVIEAVRASTDPTGNSSASTIPTSDLPGGVPTDQLKTAKEHKLGHMSSVKKNIDS